MFLAVGWRRPGLWGQLTRVEGLLLEQMWNIERGILEEAHGREGPWRLLSLASRLCQGWDFTDQVVDVSLNVHKSVCIIVSVFFFFFHPLNCESHFAPFWFGAEVIWKILCICACRLLWERPAPRKRASAFKKVLPLRKHSLTWRLLKCFPFCLHLGRFFFFFPVVS